MSLASQTLIVTPTYNEVENLPELLAAIHGVVPEAHILVVDTSIWLGEKTSVCTQLIEQLYSSSGDLNEHGQYAYYDKMGG